MTKIRKVTFFGVPVGCRNGLSITVETTVLGKTLSQTKASDKCGCTIQYWCPYGKWFMAKKGKKSSQAEAGVWPARIASRVDVYGATEKSNVWRIMLPF